MEPIFCWFTQQFHEEQSTEAYSLWRRNNKAREGCVPLRINKLEDEVVNCTTSLEREELNKWSHDQDKNEAEFQQTRSQKAASCQGNSYSLADDMLNYFFEMMHTSPDLFFTISVLSKGCLS